MSEDPIGFTAGDTNLNRYVGNSPVNGTDPSGLYDPKQLEWHHLCVQKYREQFNLILGKKYGNNWIDLPQFGWLLRAKDHRALTKEWQREWDALFDKYNKSKETKDLPTEAEVLATLRRLKRKGGRRFWGTLKRGVPAPCSFRQWENLAGKTSDKEKLFRSARRKYVRLLSILGPVAAALGAADKAVAAYEPVLVLGDQDVQDEYRQALSALQNGDHRAATTALFGGYDGTPGYLINDPRLVRGVIPRMLMPLAKRSNIGLNIAETTLHEAWKAYVQQMRDARSRSYESRRSRSK